MHHIRSALLGREAVPVLGTDSMPFSRGIISWLRPQSWRSRQLVTHSLVIVDVDAVQASHQRCILQYPKLGALCVSMRHPHAGLIHYQQNLDCFTASYIITYNSADPGTQVQPGPNPLSRLCPSSPS